MKKSKRKTRGRQLRTMRCDWCADIGQTTRSDTKTCSGKCRQRLAAFTRFFGYPPDTAPGPKLAQDAIDLEVMRLVRAERERRQSLDRSA